MDRVIEGVFLWGGIAGYLIGFMIILSGLVFKKEWQLRAAWYLTVLSYTLHTLSIAMRWKQAGHPPVYGSYEHYLAESWFFMTIYVIFSVRGLNFRKLGVAILPFCVLFLGYGIMDVQPKPQPLPPPYQSLWLWAHAVSWPGYGAFFISGVTAILYLVRERGWLQWLPSLEEIDKVIFRMIVFGFVTLTIGMGAGALWAHGLWGRYWAWDPVETWTLITWLVYGLNIHLRVTYGWKGRRAAYLALASIINVFVTLGGIGFVGGVHTTIL